MQNLHSIFPELNEAQWAKLTEMAALHREWNEKINLVSRKDIENLERHHYAPSIAAIKFLKLQPGAKIIDVGTGGGFPGLVLAVLYPDAEFTLVDSVGKKILVVEDIVKRLNLKNVQPVVARAETLNHDHDFIMGRAVADLRTFVHQTKQLIIHGVKILCPMAFSIGKAATPPWKKPTQASALSSVSNSVPYFGMMRNLRENVSFYTARKICRSAKSPICQHDTRVTVCALTLA